MDHEALKCMQEFKAGDKFKCLHTFDTGISTVWKDEVVEFINEHILFGKSAVYYKQKDNRILTYTGHFKDLFVPVKL